MHAHQFALYTDSALPTKPMSTLTLTDAALCHRIGHVLRLEPNDTCTIFNQTTVCTVTLIQILHRKNTVLVEVQSATSSTGLQPKITVYVGLPKKEALEDVAYAAAQLGATDLMPFMCKRVQRRWGGDKELERLTGIMIGACEQAKQFVLPTLHAPLPFDTLIQQLTTIEGPSLYFTPHGLPLMQVVQTITQTKPRQLALVIGPEGGLEQEEELALPQNTISSKLCSTILRTRDMGLLGLGVVRSLF